MFEIMAIYMYIDPVQVHTSGQFHFFLKNINILLICSSAASFPPLHYLVTVQMYRCTILTMP